MDYTGKRASGYSYLDIAADEFYRKCLAYILVPLLEKEILEFQTLWNTHPIRRNKKSGTPHGIPDDLYLMPSEFGKVMHYITN